MKRTAHRGHAATRQLLDTIAKPVPETTLTNPECLTNPGNLSRGALHQLHVGRHPYRPSRRGLLSLRTAFTPPNSVRAAVYVCRQRTVNMIELGSRLSVGVSCKTRQI